MNKSIAKRLRRHKQRVQYRLRDINWKEQGKPMFAAGNIHYDMAGRTRGLAYGGIGAMHLLAGQTGPVTAVDDKKYRSEKLAVLSMEFKRFRNAVIALPCRIVKTGRKIVYRLLSWNRWLVVFFRGLRTLRYPLRC